MAPGGWVSSWFLAEIKLPTCGHHRGFAAGGGGNSLIPGILLLALLDFLKADYSPLHMQTCYQPLYPCRMPYHSASWAATVLLWLCDGAWTTVQLLGSSLNAAGHLIMHSHTWSFCQPWNSVNHDHRQHRLRLLINHHWLICVLGVKEACSWRLVQCSLFCTIKILHMSSQVARCTTRGHL